MTGFPWGQLTLILLVLDLILTVVFLIRKPLLKKQCRRALARGKFQEVFALLHYAETRRLLKPKEYIAWLEEFGLEEYG
jgi:hypothetical protein